MDNTIDLINSAWQKVSQTGEECVIEHRSSTQQSSGIEETLRERIDAGCAAASFYDSLIRRTGGQNSTAVLRKICTEEKVRVRCLQTEYFLLTCDTHSPQRRRMCETSLLCGLRQAYINEKASAQVYFRAAETAEEGLSKQFTQFAHEEERHASEIKKLLHCLMK